MLTKTTLNVPKDLLEEAKMYALINKTSLSKIFTESLRRKLHGKKAIDDKLTLDDVMGTVKIIGKFKEPYKRRSDLYKDD